VTSLKQQLRDTVAIRMVVALLLGIAVTLNEEGAAAKARTLTFIETP
jgi:hypothetical protein